MTSKTFDKFLDQQIKVLKSKASETEDVMGLLIGDPQTADGGKKIKGTLAYAGVSLNNRLYLPEELKKGDGMTVPLILNHASVSGAEEELDRLPQEFRRGLEEGKEMRVGEVSLQWDPDNLTLFYEGNIEDKFFQREVDDANMAVSLGMYYDSDSPQVCDEACYTVIKGAEFHEVSLVYHPGFPIATIEAYEALQRKQRLGESVQKVKFSNEADWSHSYDCSQCERSFFSQIDLDSHAKKSGHVQEISLTKEEEAEQRREEWYQEYKKKRADLPDRSYFSQLGLEPEGKQGIKSEAHTVGLQDYTYYIPDKERENVYQCSRCGSTIRNHSKEETGLGKDMLELHSLWHERDMANSGSHKERYEKMDKAWDKPIVKEYLDGGRVWCDICGEPKSIHPAGHDFVSSQDVHDPRVKESKATETESMEEILSGLDSFFTGTTEPYNDDVMIDHLMAYGHSEDISRRATKEWFQTRHGVDIDRDDMTKFENLKDQMFESKASEWNEDEWALREEKRRNHLQHIDKALALNLENQKDYRERAEKEGNPNFNNPDLIKERDNLLKQRKKVIAEESKAKAVEMPELVISRTQGENILAILQEELEELRAEEPKDYNAIGRIRLLIMKTRKEIYPDQNPYLTIDLDYKKLEDQEAWKTSTAFTPTHKPIADNPANDWSRADTSGNYHDRRAGQLNHVWRMFVNSSGGHGDADEQGFSMWINFAQNDGISYEEAEEKWKYEIGFIPNQSYLNISPYRKETNRQARGTRYGEVKATEVIYCKYCDKVFPNNDWQKKAQHELDVHGGKQVKLFERK